MPPLMPDKTAKVDEVADFATFLASTRPKTNAELSEELNKLVGKVRDTGKPGTIALAITIKPLDGSTEVLGVNDVIKVKSPEHTRVPSITYADEKNNLSRTDPNSMPLWDGEADLKDAPAHDPATGEIKEI